MGQFFYRLEGIFFSNICFHIQPGTSYLCLRGRLKLSIFQSIPTDSQAARIVSLASGKNFSFNESQTRTKNGFSFPKHKEDHLILWTHLFAKKLILS